jgi:PPM family protein phosphatase
MFRSRKKLKKKQAAEEQTTERWSYETIASLKTDVGCHREVNEDCIRFIQPGNPDGATKKGSLALVADGMGGHSAGEVASNMAVSVISRVYYEDAENPHSALKNAFLQANREIYEASLKDESLRGMGTTCTALVLNEGVAFAAHVGDSRLYLVRDGQIYAMTEDHSEVMDMVKHGLISLEEARHHPDKNVILRALGSHADVEVSTWDEPFPVREADRFLLCSDGLYDLVEDEEIKQTILGGEPLAACESLVALARERGGYDNISVGIVSLALIDKVQCRRVPQTREVEGEI